MEKINVGKLPLENNSNETVLAILFLQSKINEIIDWVNKYEFHIIDSMVDPVVNENHLKTLEDKVEKLDKDNTLFANAVLKRFQEIEARVKFIMENGKGLKEVSYTANHQTTKMFQDCKLQDLWDEENAKLCSHGFPYSNSDEICGCKLNQEPTVKEYPCKCDCHNKMTKEELYPDNRPITNCGLCCLDEPIDKSEKIEEIIGEFKKDYFDLCETIKLEGVYEIIILSWDKIKPWLRDKLKEL